MLGHIVRQKEVNRTQCLLLGRSWSGGGDLQRADNEGAVVEEAAQFKVGAEREGQNCFPHFPLSTAVSSYTSDYKAKRF